jgi:hypothetical protein
MRHFLTLARTIMLIGLTVFGLLACGGGGGGASPSPTTTVVQGNIAAGVVVSDSAAATVTTSSTNSGALEITNASGNLASAKTGQVVYLPANDAQGIPLGYAGKIEKTADGKTLLSPAAMGDVFSTLKINYDTARDGGQIAGLIVPKNGTLQANLSPPASTQSGVQYVACQVGLQAVVDIKCKDGALSGSITLEHPLMVKRKSASDKVAAKLYAKIDISKLSSKVNIDFDATKYASTGGFRLLSTELTGQWGASMGIKLDDSTAKAEIPAWSELIRSDASNIWDDNTKVKFGKYFELSGLNGDDKKGLIPLGGIYLTPANFAAGGQTFGGELSAAQLGQIKQLGVVLWVYIDLSGNLTVSGDLKMLDITGAGFNKGFKLERVNGSLQNSIIDTKTPPNVYAPRITGSIEGVQNVGLAIAADLLVAGIRPATVKAELIGYKATASLQGDGGYKWYPAPAGFEGSLCASTTQEIYSDIQVKVAVNGKLDVGWLEVSGGVEKTWGPAKYTYWSSNDAKCVNSYTLPLSLVSTGPNASDPSKTKVELTFATAYNNAALREQVGRWQVFEEGPLQTKFYDADTSFGGAFNVALPEGKYTFTVLALHKDLKDSNNQPIEVVRSNPVTVTVTALPSADFSAAIVGGDCKKLQLTSMANAGAGSTLSNYQWQATLSGGSPLNQQGATLISPQFSLAACGNVTIAHTVTDNLGRTSTVSRNINTSTLAPSISNITPSIATVNVPVSLTVTGTNLPNTVVLSMADATCSAISGFSSTGFSVACTAASTGSKLITIKTNTAANNGVMIDATRSVMVNTVSLTTGSLTDTGITASQCYAAGSNTLVSCTSAAAIALSPTQDGMVGRDVTTPLASDGKLGFSYSTVGSYPITDCVKDNITGLVWEGKPASGTRSATNTYTNYDFATYGDVAYLNTNSLGYVAAVNAAALCGYTDWRLPTADELQTLVDYSSYGLTIDATWFPNTQGNWYWTSSPYVGYSYYAWVVSFSYGYVNYGYRYNYYYVRLVR